MNRIYYLVNILPFAVRENVRRVPLIGPAQRWFFEHFVKGDVDYRVNAGPAAGVVFPITLPQDKLIWTGTYERNLAKAIRNAVQPGAVCLDVGAYRGFFAAVMAKAGASTVHLFEPNPVNVVRLRRLIQMNADLPLHVHSVALGARPTTAQFQMLADDTMGRLSLTATECSIAEAGVLEVPVESIDHLVASGSIPFPDIIKVDVEGAEEQVIMGAFDTIEQSQPTWFIEAHSSELAKQCSQRLANHGYDVQSLKSEDPAAVSEAQRSPISHLIACGSRQ